MTTEMVAGNNIELVTASPVVLDVGRVRPALGHHRYTNPLPLTHEQLHVLEADEFVSSGVQEQLWATRGVL